MPFLAAPAAVAGAWIAANAGTIAAVGAVASVAVSAAGAGLSYYGQQQQAKSQDAMAKYNLAVQTNNANLQAAVAQRQAVLNQQIAQSNAQAHTNNAIGDANQAKAIQNEALVQADAMRDRNRRFIATQESKYQASGVVSTEGSPLAVLADSAANLEMGVANANFEANQKSQQYLNEGEQEKYAAGFSLLDAGVADYKAKAAAVGRDIQLDTAAGDFASAKNQAAGTRLASAGTLISGVANAADKTYSLYDKGAFNSFLPASAQKGY